jgi:hypothetical protein
MLTAVRAGLAYFLAVFAIGFGLGAIRVGFVMPWVGALAAVAIELPIMLGLSWLVCGAIVQRLVVARAVPVRLMMGATALALLLSAELALSVLLFGRTPAEHWAHYGEVAEQLGLAGQLGFAALPLWRRG